MEKKLEDTQKFAEMVANHQGWALNPDQEFLRSILEGLTANWNRYGYYQCPCRDSWGAREKDKDIICPCAYSRPDIEEYGHCYCGLFLDKTYAAQGKPVTPIPERRPENLYP